MDDALRAGIAVYNDGHYHAAHDAWEDRWLDLEDGTDDERLLHGLIQFTAAVHHARERNWPGAVGLAESAREYLSDPPDEHRGVRLSPIRSYLETLAADPEVIDRHRPVAIICDGEVPTLDTLGFDETAVAAVVLVEKFDADEDVLERAQTYATRDLEAGEDDSRFIALLFDFVREDDHREIVSRRLREHVERRAAREADVDGLF